MEAVVCGIDPGLGTSGYAVLSCRGDESTVIDAGVCRFDQKLPLAQRLVAIQQDISAATGRRRRRSLATAGSGSSTTT